MTPRYRSHDNLHGIADTRPIASGQRPYQDRNDGRVQIVGTVTGSGQPVAWCFLSSVIINVARSGLLSALLIRTPGQPTYPRLRRRCSSMCLARIMMAAPRGKVEGMATSGHTAVVYAFSISERPEVRRSSSMWLGFRVASIG